MPFVFILSFALHSFQTSTKLARCSTRPLPSLRRSLLPSPFNLSLCTPASGFGSTVERSPSLDSSRREAWEWPEVDVCTRSLSFSLLSVISLSTRNQSSRYADKYFFTQETFKERFIRYNGDPKGERLKSKERKTKEKRNASYEKRGEKREHRRDGTMFGNRKDRALIKGFGVGEEQRQN